MDLYAYALSKNERVNNYIQEHYGPIPRLRGVRFMRYETPDSCEGDGPQATLWKTYCGQDVIYIHTRCGGGYDETDPDSNYIACGGKEWEEAHKNLFIYSVDDECDCTYRDHYFTAVIDDNYDKICQLIEADEVID